MLKKGFTFLEILLVISFISFLSIGMIFVSNNLFLKNNLDLAEDLIVSDLRKAQLYAQSGMNDSDWGVKVLNGQLILFEGDSYSSRNPSSDVVKEIANNIEISGINEVVFDKMSGLTDDDGDIVLKAPNNYEKTIRINSAGNLSIY